MPPAKPIKTANEPPEHISDEAKGWWRRFTADFDLEPHALLVLESALSSLDRMRDAQRLIKADGLIIKDRYGHARLHPAANVERDSKALFLRLLKGLNLDLEPLNDGPGRPSTWR